MQDVSRGEGRTVLFVSHNMASIQNLCRTGILMANGTVVKTGRIEEVTSHYLTEYLEAQVMENIAARSDRNGNGKIRFTNTWFETTEGKKLDLLYSGIDCVFCIEVMNETAETLESVNVAVGIDDSNARRLTVLNNDLTNHKIMLQPRGMSVVKIKITSLPLQSDTYYFTLFSTVNGDVADWVVNAGKFYVESGDYFKTGRIIQKGQGSILMNHEFIV
jgi:lipopolysaccharide transport system ATP-binding protein